MGNPVNLTNSLNASLALGPEFITPPPLYMIGFFVLLNKSISFSI